MLEMQRLEQQQLEQNLKLKFQTNEINLQLDLKRQQQEQILLQARIAHQEKQNQAKLNIIEAKRQEKNLQRERKIREKWFEHIVSREQQTSKQQQFQQQYIGNSNELEKSQVVFDSIDDMQEKHLKRMPDFRSLLDNVSFETSNKTETTDDQQNEEEKTELNWIGDSLQVIEFVNTFGTKLADSLKAKSPEQQNTNEASDFSQFNSILSSLESFRSGLENKNEKFKREISQLVQMLLKCAINTISERNINLNESLNKINEFKEDDEEDFHNNQDEKAIIAVKNISRLVDEDDFYYIKRLKQLEANDSTYSELLRLYIKRSMYYLKQRRELNANRFNIDVTIDLFESLKSYLANLETKTFDQLDSAYKASIMAWLCDELLLSGDLSNENSNQDENHVVSCVVQDLDQAIEELNELKHEKWQLEAKSRQTKTEKLNATVILNKFKKNEDETSLELTSERDSEILKKTQKSIQQIDKKLCQIEKKRVHVKQSYEKCLNKLRSGVHLGQDRYLRHYWSLNHIGGVLIEASSKASIGSIYLSDDSYQLMPLDEKKEEEQEQLKQEEMKNKETLNEEDQVIKNYSHLIERFSTEDPFKFTLKFNNDEVASLTFRQIEYLVRNEIQQKKLEKIKRKYLNSNETAKSVVLKNSTSKWWLCDNELIFKQLIDCLAKRGYREKSLAKCLSKLNEENFTNSNSSVALAELHDDTNDQQLSSIASNTSLFNRISNNLGNLQMFEKTTQFFKVIKFYFYLRNL